MKVAEKKPVVIKSPVRITNECYELWYSKPQSLGKINKRAGYWYTEDGMRFVSSRDALEYRIRVLETAATGKEPSVDQREELAGDVRKTRVLLRKKRVGAEAHPMFEKFLKFLEKNPEYSNVESERSAK